MTPRDAQKRIVKLLGKRAAWRDTGRQTSPEERAEAHQRWEAANERFKAAKAAAEARRIELLADPEYRRLSSMRVEAYRELNKVSGRGYRITVGIDMGIAFEVRAEGDNWAEVVRALEQRQPNQFTVARVS